MGNYYHLPATLAAARGAKALAHSDDLLAQMRDLNERRLKILARQRRQGTSRPPWLPSAMYGATRI
jgi:hypothetical protein